jgi:hypothetical protein
MAIDFGTLLSGLGFIGRQAVYTAFSTAASNESCIDIIACYMYEKENTPHLYNTLKADQKVLWRTRAVNGLLGTKEYIKSFKF